MDHLSEIGGELLFALGDDYSVGYFVVDVCVLHFLEIDVRFPFQVIKRVGDLHFHFYQSRIDDEPLSSDCRFPEYSILIITIT